MHKALYLIGFFVLASGCATSTGVQTPPQTPPLTQSSCQNGEIRKGFAQPTTSGDISCIERTQTCIDGKWEGPPIYETCENHTKSCESYPHGTTLNGYLQPTTHQGIPCEPATKTCLNGQWVGPEIFTTCSEL